jgi:hypothetical protein
MGVRIVGGSQKSPNRFSDGNPRIGHSPGCCLLDKWPAQAGARLTGIMIDERG